MKFVRRCLISGVVGVLGIVGSASAQYTNASITGTVRDPQGAVVPGAKVTATRIETGEQRTTLTNEVGLYRLMNLVPGTYRLRVEAKDFAPALIEHVELLVGQTAHLDVTLEVGPLTEVATVTAEAPLINLEEGRLSGHVLEREINDLPLNGRDIHQLALLQPGVTATQAFLATNSSITSFGLGQTAAGKTPRGVNYNLDGISNNNEWLGASPSLTPTLDAIQEFQVQISNFSAEFGTNTSSVINVLTKSGSNELHGSVWWFHRNAALDAREFFDPQVAPLVQHQFGFTLGGPIEKNRLFYFASYEGFRSQFGESGEFQVETPEFRQFVFRTRPESVAARLFRQYPAPPPDPGTEVDLGSPAPGVFLRGRPDGIPDVGTARVVLRDRFTRDQGSIRIDAELGPNDRLFGRWSQEASDSQVDIVRSLSARGFRAPFDGAFVNAAIVETHVFSPRVIHEIRFGYSRTRGDRRVVPDDFPRIFLDDFTYGFGSSYVLPYFFTYNTFELKDMLSLTIGRHAIRLGGQIRRIQENSDYGLGSRGWFEFSDIFDFADDEAYYQVAVVDPRTGQRVTTPRGFRITELAFFIQDDMKLRPNFTLNLGVRYDLFGVPTEVHGLLSNIILGEGATFAERLANATVGRVARLFEGDHNNFGPRLGFAWDPFGHGRISIRGGYGIAYGRNYTNLFTNASRFNPPDDVPIIVFPFAGLGTQVVYGVPMPFNPDFATGLTPRGSVPGQRISPSGIEPGLHSSYAQDWFLGIQFNPLGDLVVEMNYVGSAGRKLPRREDVNRFRGDLLDGRNDRLNPDWSLITYVQNNVSSNYHGFNLSVRKRFSHGYLFHVAYTFGKAIDTVSDPGLGDWLNISNPLYISQQDAANARLDRGPSDFDVRQRLTVSAVWELPFFRDRSGWLAHLFGGWQLNGIATLQSGRPFSVFCSSALFCDFNADGTAGDRPNTPAFGNTLRNLSRSDYINGLFERSDFPTPDRGENGDLGRNTFRGPGYATVDLSLFKNFPLPWLGESGRLQFRIEAFNLFNRVNLFLPINDLAASQLLFGRSTATFDAREIQGALKIYR